MRLLWFWVGWLALVVSGPVGAASYLDIYGVVHDPIQNRWGGNSVYSGNNLEPHAHLSYAYLYAADLTHADLADAELDSANLTAADLTHADLTRADLRDATLDDVILSSANLFGSILLGAELTDADLSYADLRNADLTNADISIDPVRYPACPSTMIGRTSPAPALTRSPQDGDSCPNPPPLSSSASALWDFRSGGQAKAR